MRTAFIAVAALMLAAAPALAHKAAPLNVKCFGNTHPVCSGEPLRCVCQPIE